MSDTVYDFHPLAQRKGDRLSDTIHRHLITSHNRILTSSPTLNEMSDLHAKLHKAHPETDSDTTKQQKQSIETRLVALGVELPDWVYVHSYLSDLKTLERILTAADLARPPRYDCCSHCDHSISQPDTRYHERLCSEPGCQTETGGTSDRQLDGHQDGIDNPGKG